MNETAPASTPPAAAPKRGRQRTQLYMTLWMVLAGLALTYLIVVASKPELAADLLGSGTGQRAGTLADTRRIAADVAQIRQQMGQVQMDVAKIKTEQVAQIESAKALTTRLAALEKGAQATAQAASAAATQAAAPATSPVASASTQAPVAPATVADAPAAKQAPQPVAIVNGKAAAQTVAKAAPTPPVQTAQPTSLDDRRLIEIGAPARLETGSVAQPATGQAAQPAQAVAKAASPAVFGAPVVKVPPPQVGVQIANGPSLDALRLSWSLLSERHGDALKRLEPRYVPGSADQGGETYDLVAGPVRNQAEAQRVCRQLAAKGVPCKVSTFGGDAL